MNQNYISDNIFIKDNKLYEQHSNKDILINKNNWHKSLKAIIYVNSKMTFFFKLSKCILLNIRDNVSNKP